MSIAVVGIVGAGTMGGGIAINLAQHGLPCGCSTAVRMARPGPSPRHEPSSTAMSRGSGCRPRRRRRHGPAFDRTRSRRGGGGRPGDRGRVRGFRAQGQTARRAEPAGGADDAGRHQHQLPSGERPGAAHGIPARFLGLHYFSPAAINPIVEVVSGEPTSPQTIDAALAFTRATGKQPLRCRDSYGFAINRFFCPYTNEAARALDEGSGHDGRDRPGGQGGAGCGGGPVPGDEPDQAAHQPARHPQPGTARRLLCASRVDGGRRRGRSSWAIGEPAPSARKRQRIADRLRLGGFLPVLQALDEGVAAPADFDHGAREALKMGLPPCAEMDRLGRAEVARILEPALSRMASPGQPRWSVSADWFRGETRRRSERRENIAASHKTRGCGASPAYLNYVASQHDNE